MKFQIPSFKFFLNGRTKAQTDKPKAICSPLFQSWGHNENWLFHFCIKKLCFEFCYIINRSKSYFDLILQDLINHNVKVSLILGFDSVCPLISYRQDAVCQETRSKQ